MIRAIAQFLFWTLVCGIFYPVIVYGVGKLSFPDASSGSLMKKGSTIIGSELLAQRFDSPKYFHSRPSSSQYDASAGGASNQGYTSRTLEKNVQDRKSYWINRGGSPEIPTELLYASASGLDPHLSPDAVKYQIPLVGQARGWSASEIQTLETAVQELTENPQWGLFGDRKINVLKLNLRIDSIQTNPNIPK